MDITNCQQCSKPFVKKGSLQLCPGCLDQERGMYEFYYQKLSPKLKDLNMGYIARQTTLDKERLAQTLEFRLGIQDKGELKLWKRGTCNVCGARQDNPDSPEPICIGCLDMVLNLAEKDKRALQEDERIDPRAEFQPSAESERTYPASQGRKTHLNPGLQTGQETVSRDQYDKVMAELAMYRNHFGELPAEARKVDLSELRSLSAVPKESQDVLMILDQKDEDIVLNSDEVNLLENAHLYVEDPNSGRQYGFKRDEVV